MAKEAKDREDQFKAEKKAKMKEITDIDRQEKVKFREQME